MHLLEDVYLCVQLSCTVHWRHTHPQSTIDHHCQCRVKLDLIHALPSRFPSPLSRRLARFGLSFGRHLEAGEVLEKANKEERYFVVGELLAEADSGSCIEGEEDEGIVGEILSKSLVEEAVRVESLGYGQNHISSQLVGRESGFEHVPSGPHRSVRRCMSKTLYVTLVRAGINHDLSPFLLGNVVALMEVLELKGTTG
jgi:hypothetical protein